MMFRNRCHAALPLVIAWKKLGMILNGVLLKKCAFSSNIYRNEGLPVLFFDVQLFFTKEDGEVYILTAAEEINVYIDNR